MLLFRVLKIEIDTYLLNKYRNKYEKTQVKTNIESISINKYKYMSINKYKYISINKYRININKYRNKYKYV